MNTNRIISYIGSKVKLYDFLDETILKNHNINNENISFYDLFSGTSAVSNLIKNKTKWNINTNDFMKYSYILSYFLDIEFLLKEQKELIINRLQILSNLYLNTDLEKIDKTNLYIFNEFSTNGNPISIDEENKKILFSNQPYKNSRMFFSEKNGIEIDLIKNKIKEWFNNKEISEIEKNIFLIFLLNYADKNANTTSVYGAYLKLEHKLNFDKPFLDKKLLTLLTTNNNIKKFKNNIIHYNLDILNAIKIIDNKIYNKKNNIIYLDPPYTTRSYESNYHILNYIVDFDFHPLKDIKFNSKTAQFKKIIENPFRKKELTYKIFESMIENSLEKANNVYISYNTDGIIKEEDIDIIYKKLLNSYKNLKLLKYYKSYKRFKSSNKNTKELQMQMNNLKNKTDLTNDEYINICNIQDEIKNNKIKNKEFEELNLLEIIWHFKLEN